MVLRCYLALLALLGLGLIAKAAQAHPVPLRVVTFNTAMNVVIHWRGARGLRRQLLEHAQLAGAHVLALQEVCLNRRKELAPYLEVMRTAHGSYYHYADYASKKLGERCDKGQALISAYPMLAAGTLVLPSLGAARVAVWADLRVPIPGFERLRIYSLHLSNRDRQNQVPQARRRLQVHPVLEHALGFLEAYPGAPIIVAGDFNSLGSLTEPWVREPVLQDMLEYFQPSQPRFSPTFLLPYQLDWIFFANLQLVRSSTVTLLYSDHLPVVADFRF